MKDLEFTGEDLHDLVLAVEIAVGSRQAGCTPLGRTIISLCEEAIRKDEEAKKV